MQVVSANPLSEVSGEVKIDETPRQANFIQRNSGIFKTLFILGIVGAAGVVGFVVGNSNASSSSEASGSGNGSPALPSTMTQAKEILGSAYADQKIEAASRFMTIEEINLLVDDYEATLASGATWDDPNAPEDFVLSIKMHRDEQIAAESGTRELTQEDRLRGYRELAAYDSAIISETWNEIENANWGNNPIQTGDDQVLVYAKNNKCFILARESNSFTDWVNNLDLGDEAIKSIKKYTIQDSSCGCDKKFLWWCRRYKTCSTYKNHADGYDGFVKAYNNMRLTIWSRMQSTCGSLPKVFGGFSRGGGVIAPLVYTLRKDNLVPASQMTLVTFGCPRSLEDSASDYIHGQFPQYRLIYKKDPVPSIPYGWMGYKHFGDGHCHSCGYAPVSRDQPSFSWVVDGLADHTSYDQYPF